jgi:predicted  nucleic acid-binding Zn-ribbon protein
MFKRDDALDSLTRDLCRARDKRDALTSDVTALTAQITELEARFSEEKDRRDREHLGTEIEEVKRRLEETAHKAAPLIAKLADETERAAAIVPEAREVQRFLTEVAKEVETVIGSLSRQLQRQAEEVDAAAQGTQPLPRPPSSASEPPKSNALFAWLRREKKNGLEGGLRQENGDAATVL